MKFERRKGELYGRIGIGRRVHILVEYNQTARWAASLCGWCGEVQLVKDLLNTWPCRQCFKLRVVLSTPASDLLKEITSEKDHSADYY
jgi:hypothetical protein